MSDTLEQPCELKEVATYTTPAASGAMSEHKTESCEVINCYECCQEEWREIRAERDALREQLEQIKKSVNRERHKGRSLEEHHE